jgi:hypothetical protein
MFLGAKDSPGNERHCRYWIHRLKSSTYVLILVETGLVQLAFDVSRNLLQLLELGRRYAERNPDLADLCLIRMSELHPRHVVITWTRAIFESIGATSERLSRCFVRLA